MLNKKPRETQEGSAVETVVSPLLESLLARKRLWECVQFVPSGA